MGKDQHQIKTLYFFVEVCFYRCDTWNTHDCCIPFTQLRGEGYSQCHGSCWVLYDFCMFFRACCVILYLPTCARLLFVTIFHVSCRFKGLEMIECHLNSFFKACINT